MSSLSPVPKVSNIIIIRKWLKWYCLHFQKVPVLIDEIEERTIRDEKIVSELKLEMFDVSPSTISWNIDKVARRDKKLRPVFIPF